MSTTVWDCPLTLEPAQEVELPEGATPLTVLAHNSGVSERPVCLFALADPGRPIQRRRVVIFDGGQSRVNVRPEDYVGTVVLGAEHQYVAHVFLPPAGVGRD